MRIAFHTAEPMVVRTVNRSSGILEVPAGRFHSQSSSGSTPSVSEGG
jgi:hypothetical protein